MNIALVGIEELGHFRMELGIGTQDMVEHTNVGIPQVLRRLDEVAQPYEDPLSTR